MQALIATNIMCDVCNQNIDPGELFLQCPTCPESFDLCIECRSAEKMTPVFMAALCESLKLALT
jgi:hypothetical protein